MLFIIILTMYAYISEDDMNSLPMTPPHIRSIAERDARAMEAATKAMEEATKRIEEAAKSNGTPHTIHPALTPFPRQEQRDHTDREDRENTMDKRPHRSDRENADHREHNDISLDRLNDNRGERIALKERERQDDNIAVIKSEEPSAKKLDRGVRDDERHRPLISPPMHPTTTNIKINSRGM